MGYSQYGEDDYILPFLAAPDLPKYVVDVGANDGVLWSNTRALIQSGYYALMIEPMPEFASRCRRHYEGNKNVNVVEAAISEIAGEASFFVNNDRETDLFAMRSSLNRDMVPSSKIEEIRVKTYPLSDLLMRFACPARYALLSVDAEGHDLDVLKSAKLDCYRPYIVCVEEEGGQTEAIEDYLRLNEYVKINRLGPNGIYRDSHTYDL